MCVLDLSFCYTLFYFFLLTSEQKISWLCYFEFKMYSCRDDVFGFEIIEIFVSFIIGFVGVQCLIYSTTIFNWSWVKSDEFIDVTIKAFERRETNLLIVCKNQEVIKLNLSAKWIRFIFRVGTLLYMSLFPPVCRAPYLRNRTSSNHNFRCRCVKWWYILAFFSIFWNFDFLSC